MTEKRHQVISFKTGIRILKKLFIFTLVTTAWIEQVDSCTTKRNTRETEEHGVNIQHTDETNKGHSKSHTKSVYSRIKKSFHSQIDKSSSEESFKSESNEINNVIKALKSDRHHLQIKLPEFKHFIQEDFVQPNLRNFDNSLSSGTEYNTEDNAHQTTKSTTKDEEHTNNEIRTNKRTFPYQVAVVITKPRGSNRNSVISIPLEADMTVFNTLLSATRTFMHRHLDHDHDNPFNILIDYDRRLECYVTINAVGVDSRRRHAWIFSVINSDNEVTYRGQCIPGNDVILRPASILHLTFARIRSNKST